MVGIRCVVGCLARFGNVDGEFDCLAVLESGIYGVSNPLQRCGEVAYIIGKLDGRYRDVVEGRWVTVSLESEN